MYGFVCMRAKEKAFHSGELMITYLLFWTETVGKRKESLHQMSLDIV